MASWLNAKIKTSIHISGQNYTFLAASVTIATFVVWEFNPFVRFDGYWVLSDWTGTPNLLKKANKQFRDSMRYIPIKTFFTNPIHSLIRIRWQEQILFMYGLLNTIFLIAVMGYTLLIHWVTIRDFPFIVLTMIQQTIQGQIPYKAIEEIGIRNLIIVLTFYLLAIPWLWIQLKLLIKHGRNNENNYFAFFKSSN